MNRLAAAVKTASRSTELITEPPRRCKSGNDGTKPKKAPSATAIRRIQSSRPRADVEESRPERDR